MPDPYRQQQDIVVNPRPAVCPDSWWTANISRSEWMAKQAERQAAMKQTRHAGYGRADGVDAQ